LQNRGDLVQAAGSDPIPPLLVVLYLLEVETERSAKSPLAHAQRLAPHSQPLADMLIDRIWDFLDHYPYLLKKLCVLIVMNIMQGLLNDSLTLPGPWRRAA
jgi:hypothetical protein